MKLFRKLLHFLIPSPIKVDFEKENSFKVDKVSKLPSCVFWDEKVPVLKTTNDVEYVRTPDERFENLEGYYFEPNYLDIFGLRMHYLDEGPSDAPIILLLHGQPSWAYLYRKMLPFLVGYGYRCIVPDLIGMGRSDKPIKIGLHTYENHIESLTVFLKELKLKNLTLFCQDWGGLIGLRVVADHPQLFDRVAVSNSDLPLWNEKNNPFYIPNPVTVNCKVKTLKKSLAKHAFASGRHTFQAWINYCLTAPNLKASEVIKMGSARSISKKAEKAYNAPFPSFIYTAAPRTFPAMAAGIRGQNSEAWDKLATFDKPFITFMGEKDRILGSKKTQQKLVSHIPGAKNQKHLRLKKTGHFSQEDSGEELSEYLHRFISENPVNEK